MIQITNKQYKCIAYELIEHLNDNCEENGFSSFNGDIWVNNADKTLDLSIDIRVLFIDNTITSITIYHHSFSINAGAEDLINNFNIDTLKMHL